MDRLSIREARRYLLITQGLFPPRHFKGKAGILEIVRRLKCIQFDPIDIVGRNHEIALQARVSGFSRDQLDGLMYRDRVLVEGWDKQMSFGPIEDRPNFARERVRFNQHHRYREDGPLESIFPIIRKEIASRGFLSSLEIENDLRLDWAWAPSRAVRAALEALWFRGELMIHHREGSRRYFDFTERLLPGDLADPVPGTENRFRTTRAPELLENSESYIDWRITRRIGAVGALRAKSGDGWLGLEINSSQRRESLNRLLDRKVLTAFSVRDLGEPMYCLSADGSRFETALNQNRSGATKAAVLAPLDNLLWDRDLIRRLFNFDYVWEVYKPASSRRWGYYVLPVIYGDRLIARFEPGRDRSTSRLIVKRWWNEAGIRVSSSMINAVTVALNTLARSNGLKTVHVEPQAAEEKVLSGFN